MESFWILAVDSRNKVSFGGILWKTTLEIDDFPLLLSVSPVSKAVVVRLTFVDPSITISAFPSLQDLEQAQGPSLHLSSRHCGGSVHRHVQDLAELD